MICPRVIHRLRAPLLAFLLAALTTPVMLACGFFPEGTPQTPTAPVESGPAVSTDGFQGTDEPGTGVEIKPSTATPSPTPTVAPSPPAVPVATPTQTPSPDATPLPTSTGASPESTPTPTTGAGPIVSTPVSTPTAGTESTVRPVTGSEQFTAPEKTEQKYPQLGSTLGDLIAKVEAGEVTLEEAAQEAPLYRGESVAVTFYLSGNVAGVVAFLKDKGVSPRNVGEDYIEAYVPLLLLPEASVQSGVLSVRVIQPPESLQKVTGHGPSVHATEEWNVAGFGGAGIRVGIIDDGFVGFSGLMGDELPSTVEARCYPQDSDSPTGEISDCEWDSAHGTAVSEAVMDISPDVSLYIANVDSNGDVHSAVTWMIEQDVDVVNHSMSWLFDGPGDGESPDSSSPLNALDRAVDEGIVWVNAAGNERQNTWFGAPSDSDSDGVIEFAANDEGINFVLSPGNLTIQLRWDDNWSGAVRDLDLYIFAGDTNRKLLMSEDEQSGRNGDKPFEWIPSRGWGSFYIVVVNRSESLPSWIQLTLWGNVSMEYYTDNGSIGNPAESANTGMLAVGAAPWDDINTIEDFSSRGPAPDGRIKPDVVAADCGESRTYPELDYRPGCWFPGTSQAAPHVAGLAALVRQRFSDFTPAQVVSYLKDHAEQRIGSPDPNNIWGHGFAMLPTPTELLGSPSIQSISPDEGSLDVEWVTPEQIGGSAIVAYDLRHIPSSAQSKADSDWTVVQDAWSVSGSLQYTITGLTDGVQYGVQVRAVNTAGDGPWSATLTGTTAAAAPAAPTALTATANGQTQIDLSWTAPSNDGGTVITGYWIEVSTDSSNWSDLESNTRLHATSYSHSGLSPGSTRFYRISAINAAGTSPVSNLDSATTGAAPAPDLVVDRPTVSEGAPVSGAGFTLSATVRNQGSGASVSTTLRYYQSTDSTISTRDTEVGTDTVFRIGVSGSGDESISQTAPSTPGTYYYGACVDAVSDESDANNNCSLAVTVNVGAAPAPDQVVDTPTVDTSAPAAGASFTLNATVRNQGNGASVSTTLRYFRSTDSTITTSDTEVGTDSISGLNPSSNSDESISQAAPSTPGTYYYGACVDAVSDEADTNNNCSLAVTVNVGAAPAPDLVVDTPTVSESAPVAGASFTLSATVRNQGNGRSDSTTLRYYQSTDSTISTRDTEVGTDTVFRIGVSGSGDESISQTAPSTPGTYYYGACVDAVAGESDTTNNCSLAVTVNVGAAPAPDLAVDTPTVSESAPAAGASFTLNATVRNQGNGASVSTTLRYFRSTDSTISTGDTEVGTDQVSAFSASGSGAESISQTAPSTPGTYYYGACVDAVAGESDTTNNCSLAVTVNVGAAPVPDLIVDTPTVDTSAPAAGASFTLNATVRNQGSGSAVSTMLRYYRSTDSTITTSDTEAGTDQVSALSASGSGAESISQTAPSTPGTYYYGACVDAVSDEADTNNNCSLAVTVTVGPAPVPDLIVDTPTVDTSAPAAGASFTLNATVRNQGGGSAVSTTLRYYQSTDSTISTSDTEVGTDPVFRLDATESGAESIILTAPSTAGTYYYGACVDTVSDETDATNNCSNGVTVTVGAAPVPDLIVDTPTVDTSAPAAGASFTLNATVRNQGGGASVSTTLRYYRSTDSTITTSDTEAGTDQVSALSASGSGAESISQTAPSTPGTYYYGACVDAVSDEADTNNNCSSPVPVTVGVAPAPDLTVDQPTVDTSAPAAGASFTLNATVRNQGNGASVSTTLRYFRSTDSTISTSDTEVGTDQVSALSASGSGAESISQTAPSTPGTYYYGACVDSVSEESDATDNCSLSVAVTVGAALGHPTNQSYSRQGSTTIVSWNAVAGADHYNIYHDDFFSSSCRLSSGNPSFCEELATNVVGTSYTHTTPDDEENYYWVTACNSGGCSEIDSDNPATFIDTRPSSPANQSYSRQGSTTIVNWDAVAGADHYNIYHDDFFGSSCRLSSGNPSFCEELATNVVGTSYTHPTPDDEENYYWVTACNSGGCSEIDSDNPARLEDASPAPDLVVDTPTASERAPTAGASFTLNATVRNQGNGASVSTTLRYYQSTDSTITIGDTEVGTDPVFRLDATESGAESISLTAPSTSGTYHYGACVDSVSDESDTTNNCSAAASLTVAASASAPDAPTGLTATANGQTEINLSWTAPSDDGGADITGYRIEESTNGSSWSDLVSDTDSTTTSYSHTDLMAGSTRHYRVSAINSADTSTASNVDSATTDSQSATKACATGGAVPNAANNPGLVADCEALLAGKDTLRGTVDLNWSTDTPITDWDGVISIYRRDRITWIALEKGLEGTIPAELGGLTELSQLSLTNNKLTGEIPPELGNLSNLTELNLGNNQLNGAIPGELGGLANLILLDLSMNELSGAIPQEFAGLSNLHSLRLHQNQLTGSMPAQLSSLANLRRLILSNNKLSGTIPTEFGNLSKLQTLSLDSNQLTGSIPPELGRLTELVERLSLSRNQLSGEIPPELGNLSKLTLLYLSGNRLTGDFPSELGNLSMLEGLSLDSNQLTGCVPSNLESQLDRSTLWSVGLPFCTSATAPDAPTGLTATADGQTQIDLSWNAPSDDGGATITGYRIEVSTDGSSWSDLVSDTDSTGTSYSHTGLTAGSTRHYRVSAINSAGTSEPSISESATTDAATAPTGLTATADGQTQIDLSWNAPSDDGGAAITGYRIEVSTDGSSWSDLVANTDFATTSYSHTGLMAGSTRHYRVSAINSAGTSEPSSSDSATTDSPAATTAPDAPTGLTATADGQTQIDLSWNAPSDDGGADISGYKIEVSTNGTSWSNLVSDTDSTVTSYSHVGLTAGSTRHYRVSAINSAGTGLASNTDSATTAEEPVADATCTVDLVVEPGESCTYPGTSREFSVDSNGTGRFLFASSGSSIELRDTTINGVTYTFVASKQGDGNWIVEEVG